MKTIPADLEAKIDEINSWLFHGDQIEIAKRACTKPTRVSEVLNKRRAPRKDILEAGIEVMNENKARFECGQKMKIA